MRDAERMFVIPLSYGDRVSEKVFLKDLLNNFDRDALIGCIILVNNNVYNLSTILALNFEKGVAVFEEWILKNYPAKSKDMRLTFEDYFYHVSNRGFNVFTLLDEDSVDRFFTEEANNMFLFHGENRMNEILPQVDKILMKSTIFLSHSSVDKPKVDEVYAYLHSKGIRAWYDKFEIDVGDSITDKINDGLENSKVGLIFLSKNFLNSKTGWTKSEMNYFFTKKMREKEKKFFVVNLDLAHDELPPLLQDYKYFDFQSVDFFLALYTSLKKMGF